MQRSTYEKVFLWFFLPAVVLIYTIKAYPGFLTGLMGIDDPFGTFFFVGGKSPNFWYQTLYTGIIAVICLNLLLLGRNPYSKKSTPLSKYQKLKFTSILIAQTVGFYFFPFVMPMLKTGVWQDRAPQVIVQVEERTSRVDLEKEINYSPTAEKFKFLLYADNQLVPESHYELENYRKDGSFFATAINLYSPLPAGTEVKATAFHLAHKMAHVYLSPAFFSNFAFLYMFLIIPLGVWFFGKRYCSWICACGNLAETVGVTPWGNKWVKEGTPRGDASMKAEWIQMIMLIFSVVVGLSAILNAYHVIHPATYDRLWYLQDFLTDFIFGSLIGILFYPFYGTRMWCRYGCPMARWMKIFGRWSKSKFAVVPNDNCQGIGACTQACPMGIDVASYAHKEKKPIETPFGLAGTACIGCGGCIDSCPVDALSFQNVTAKEFIIADAKKVSS